MISKTYDLRSKQLVSLGETYLPRFRALGFVGDPKRNVPLPPSGAVLRCLPEDLILEERCAASRLEGGIEATKASVAFASLERSLRPAQGGLRGRFAAPQTRSLR